MDPPLLHFVLAFVFHLFSMPLTEASTLRQQTFSEETYLNDVTSVVLRGQSGLSLLECGLLCLEIDECSDLRIGADGACLFLKGTVPGEGFIYTKAATDVCGDDVIGNEAVCATVNQTSLAIGSGKISQIVIYYGWIVDGIRFHYGSVEGELIGKTTPDIGEISLEDDEFIEKVSSEIFCGDENDYLHDAFVNLKFYSTKGRVFGPYGNAAEGACVRSNSYVEISGYRLLTMSVTTPCPDHITRMIPIFNAC
ncbi:hypothetical protein CAPTEDRAFT_212809 [Capitella teleta]|uniref:Jacalin-type lectin domain-containing protein n=1 Tax=Capitella teleta TaxID=283909 RepID=R7T6W4_CAPTE|nr:hypothetical protein CAPTEDRAFT_212809 [Capitella teleta]|eukprot:ELT89265.1 hypothetical protein CAPTEDRAFT_212809 [Capitella teleta]